MSAGGRLSMTNQPRSSNVSPAVDPPAPDTPVMMRNSLIVPLPPAAAPPSGARCCSIRAPSARSCELRGGEDQAGRGERHADVGDIEPRKLRLELGPKAGD